MEPNGNHFETRVVFKCRNYTYLDFVRSLRASTGFWHKNWKSDRTTIWVDRGQQSERKNRDKTEPTGINRNDAGQGQREKKIVGE